MKALHWIGSSKKDLLDMPDEVQSEFGHTLYLVQEGDKPDNVKPLKGLRARSGGNSRRQRLPSGLYSQI